MNSQGDIFLLSTSGLKAIDVYNSEMFLMGSLFEVDNYLDFPYDKPPQKIMTALYKPSINNMKKLVTLSDEIIALSNVSLLIYRYNKERRLVHSFRIEHPRFIDDYRKRLHYIIYTNKGWLDPFGTMILDRSGNVCLCYFNSENDQSEIYRYTMNGLFIDTIRIEGHAQKTNQIVSACDARGNMYSINDDREAIVIYRERN